MMMTNVTRALQIVDELNPGRIATVQRRVTETSDLDLDSFMQPLKLPDGRTVELKMYKLPKTKEDTTTRSLWPVLYVEYEDGNDAVEGVLDDVEVKFRTHVPEPQHGWLGMFAPSKALSLLATDDEASMETLRALFPPKRHSLRAKLAMIGAAGYAFHDTEDPNIVIVDEWLHTLSFRGAIAPAPPPADDEPLQQ